jgi:uncharacterized membrane protein YfcA
VHLDFDLFVALAGMFVGFTVGLTGMGGGALMTPILVLFFGVQPLAAVSSDLVASFFMKPVGSAVHLRHGTVNRRLVLFLVLGSVPSAFAGVFAVRALGAGSGVQETVRQALGVALLLATVSIAAKAFLQMREVAREYAEGRRDEAAEVRRNALTSLQVRAVPTVLIGVVGGLIVGMTSVGSGSLIIVLLLLLYPSLKASQLVGTDLVQAVPLVGAAALGHLLFGDFQLGLTGSLLLGALPGVYLGARCSAQAPGGIVRRALVIVLLASGLKLIHVQTVTIAWVLLAVVIVAPLAWAGLRVLSGLPARPRPETG